MGCALCQRRQNDPARGPSDWRRGVVVRPGRRTEQVLVCPDCQTDPAWQDVLARCPGCGATTLSMKLGEVTCRQCGAHGAVDGPQPAPEAVDTVGPARLGADVAAAIDRVLGRSAGAG